MILLKVGIDIDALIHEAKVSVMREFISLMDRRTEREMEEAVANVRVIERHVKM